MLLANGEIPRAHEVFQHGALFELVFDAVRMVRTGHFEKFLKVLIRLPHMVLQISFGDRDILLIGVIRFLVMVVAIAFLVLLPLAPFLVPLPEALGGAPGCHRGPLSHRPGQRRPQPPLR
jgi:hypothetical protein